MEVNTSQMLNPKAPMAYLMPETAYETTIAAYIAVGVVGALIWDILINVDGDYRLLFKRRISFATAAYFLSRESVLIFVLLNTVFQRSIDMNSLAAPLDNCHTIQITINALNHLASCSTALLFYLRIWDMFENNHYALGTFFALWLSVLAGTIAVPLGVSPAAFLGPSQYCKYGAVMASANTAPITFAVNNTFLLLAAVWQLMPRSSSTSGENITWSNYVAKISKAVFQDGQAYYSVAVLCNWGIVIVAFLERDVSAIWFTFTVFNLAVTNMMVSRVYRFTILGDYVGDCMTTTKTMPGIEIQGALRKIAIRHSITMDITRDLEATRRTGDGGGIHEHRRDVEPVIRPEKPKSAKEFEGHLAV